jgi:hypothetical protein
MLCHIGHGQHAKLATLFGFAVTLKGQTGRLTVSGHPPLFASPASPESTAPLQRAARPEQAARQAAQLGSNGCTCSQDCMRGYKPKAHRPVSCWPWPASSSDSRGCSRPPPATSLAKLSWCGPSRALLGLSSPTGGRGGPRADSECCTAARAIAQGSLRAAPLSCFWVVVAAPSKRALPTDVVLSEHQPWSCQTAYSIALQQTIMQAGLP